MKFLSNKRGMDAEAQVLKWILALGLLAAAGFAFANIFMRLG